MKKVLSVLTSFCMLMNYVPWSSVHAVEASTQNTSTKTLEEIAEDHRKDDGGYVVYKSGNWSIYDANGLKAFADRVNKSNTFEGKVVSLEDDIDLSSICGEEKGSWVPIGTGKMSPSNHEYFEGRFDGKDHTIKNLYVCGEYTLGGFFGSIMRGSIENVNFTNVYIKLDKSGYTGGYVEHVGMERF